MSHRLGKRLRLTLLAPAAVIAAMFVAAGGASAQTTPAAPNSPTSVTTTATATATSTAGGVTLDAYEGDGAPGYSVNAFLPQKLTVLTGTTVNWQFPWYEPHELILENGPLPNSAPAADTSPFDFDGTQNYVYSGAIFGDPANPPSFAIKFGKAGTYKLECMIHPGMVGQITVVDSGQVDTQDSIIARGTAEDNAAMAALKAAAAADASSYPKVTQQADGSHLYQVDMPAGVPVTGLASNYIQQYIPQTVDITAGDSVEWTGSADNTHTVTFNVANGGFDPTTTDPFSLPAQVPANNVFDGGTEYINSGLIGGDGGPDAGPNTPPPATSFTLKFTKAGSYAYLCLIHEPQGMTGTVDVAAQAVASPTATPTTATAPLPPNTGTGNATSDSPRIWAGLGMLAALLLAGGGMAAFALRRR